MKTNKSITFKEKAASIMMLLALVWLTISIPFVYSCQQTIAKQQTAKSTGHATANDNQNGDNSVSNTTEEKSSNNPATTLAEEYLHHIADEAQQFKSLSAALHHEHEATYIAFHGELLCPPPNVQA